ncbi:hypothetical protein [Rubritalea tangerina]|uniref:hypothetical protein n=1 Tax=Rubritalea tangerina TaxID=430798 RepID=UPI00361BDE45
MDLQTRQILPTSKHILPPLKQHTTPSRCRQSPHDNQHHTKKAQHTPCWAEIPPLG